MTSLTFTKTEAAHIRVGRDGRLLLLPAVVGLNSFVDRLDCLQELKKGIRQPQMLEKHSDREINEMNYTM